MNLREERQTAVDHYAANAQQSLGHSTDSKAAKNALGFSVQNEQRLPLLTQEEEQHYGRQVRRGDLRARNLFVCHNLRLVNCLAGKYRNSGLSHEDLVSEGCLGLIRAVEKFDPSLGFRFSTYAIPWVRQAMERAIMRMGQTVRVPYGVAMEQRKLARIDRSLQGTAEPVDVTSLAQHSGQTKQRVRNLLEWQVKVGSLDALPAGYNGMPTTEPTGTELERSRLYDLLASWISELAPLQRKIIKLRFGVGRHESYSLQDTAQRLGLSRNRVRYLQNCALEQLKQRFLGASLGAADLLQD